jgi:hypothetical protein
VLVTLSLYNRAHASEIESHCACHERSIYVCVWSYKIILSTCYPSRYLPCPRRQLSPTLHGGSCGIHSTTEMASLRVTPPEPLDFSTPNEWAKWFRRLQRFRIASGLATGDEETQVNTLIYCMGDKADDILRSFQLPAED